MKLRNSKVSHSEKMEGNNQGIESEGEWEQSQETPVGDIEAANMENSQSNVDSQENVEKQVETEKAKSNTELMDFMRIMLENLKSEMKSQMLKKFRKFSRQFKITIEGKLWDIN